MTFRPHENCYWVVPGRLMAGEYPQSPQTNAQCEYVLQWSRLDRIARVGY